MKKAFLSEVFSSIQGEGIYVGVPQIFVRFAGCNRSCAYCDTPTSAAEPSFRIRKEIGSARCGQEHLGFELRPNPISDAVLHDIVARMQRLFGPHHSLSLTGGEPLLQADFLQDFLIGESPGLPAYLETNGTLPEACARIIQHLSIIAADIKLPSCTGEPLDFDVSRNFLEVAHRKELFVKIVLTAEADQSELEEAVAAVAAVDAAIPLVLQPVTPRVGIVPPALAHLTKMRVAASRILKDVRIIPQVHKFLGAP